MDEFPFIVHINIPVNTEDEAQAILDKVQMYIDFSFNGQVYEGWYENKQHKT